MAKAQLLNAIVDRSQKKTHLKSDMLSLTDTIKNNSKQCIVGCSFTVFKQVSESIMMEKRLSSG